MIVCEFLGADRLASAYGHLGITKGIASVVGPFLAGNYVSLNKLKVRTKSERAIQKIDEKTRSIQTDMATINYAFQ